MQRRSPRSSATATSRRALRTRPTRLPSCSWKRVSCRTIRRRAVALHRLSPMHEWRPPMKDPHEVFLSAPDAAELRALLGARVNNKARSHAVEELSALLAHARIVAPERLAADRVAIGSTVT